MIYRLNEHPQYIEQIQSIVYREWMQYIIHEYGIGPFKINPDRYYIVIESNQLCGFASVDPCDLQTLFPKYTPWLADVYVFPEYRGKNVATNLIQNITKEHPVIYLWCKEELEVFYSKLGWTRLHRIYYLDTWIVICVKK